MLLSRVIAAVTVLAVGAVIVSAPACIVATDHPNASDCLKADECASKLCVQGTCVARNDEACESDQGCASGKCIAAKCAPYTYAPAEAGVDSGPPADTGSADTGSADTAKADTTSEAADAHD